MSACPVIDWRAVLADQPGYSKSRRGAAEANKPPEEVLYNKFLLRRTAGSQLAHIIEDIIDNSWGRDEYSKVDPLKEALSLNRDVRYVQMLLQAGVKYRLVARHPTKRGWYKPIYENFTGEPIPTLWEEQQERRKAMATAERSVNVEEIEESGSSEPEFEGGEPGPGSDAAPGPDTDVGTDVSPDCGAWDRPAQDGSAGSGGDGALSDPVGRDPDDRPRSLGTERCGVSHGSEPGGEGAVHGVHSEIYFASHGVVTRIECPTCHGRGYLDQGAGTEIYFGSPEMDFHPAEMDFARNAATSCVSSDLQPAKKVLDFSRKSKQAACFDPGNGFEIQKWLARQPWGAVFLRTGNMPLPKRHIDSVLAALAERGWTDVEFVNKMLEGGETISPGRENIVGLVISLIKTHCPPRPYSAGDRPTGPLGAKGPRPPG